MINLGIDVFNSAEFEFIRAGFNYVSQVSFIESCVPALGVYLYNVKAFFVVIPDFSEEISSIVI